MKSCCSNLHQRCTLVRSCFAGRGGEYGGRNSLRLHNKEELYGKHKQLRPEALGRGDRILHTEFNDNWDKIDTALKAMPTAWRRCKRRWPAAETVK